MKKARVPTQRAAASMTWCPAFSTTPRVSRMKAISLSGLSRVTALRQGGLPVRLDAVLVEAGDNSARIYAENQAKTCSALGIDYKLHRITPAHHEGTAFDEIAGRILLLIKA